jgi:hypothetical protein
MLAEQKAGSSAAVIRAHSAGIPGRRATPSRRRQPPPQARGRAVVLRPSVNVPRPNPALRTDPAPSRVSGKTEPLIRLCKQEVTGQIPVAPSQKAPKARCFCGAFLWLS